MKIYTDTNVLHYFGQAFHTESVPAEIAVQLLLAPIAILELLSQLGTKDAESAFAGVQALPRVHNPEACGVLPWSDDFFRMCLFKTPPSKEDVIRSINNAIVRVLNAGSVSELRAEGEEMRRLLDASKQMALNDFAALRDSMQAEGRLDPAEDRRIFAQSIARKADADRETVDVDSSCRRSGYLGTSIDPSGLKAFGPSVINQTLAQLRIRSGPPRRLTSRAIFFALSQIGRL
ncbi:hypothetical protein [Granulicella sp. L46]|uniref:hypothetical protein n=1 Tax=Granulicella sp. L46 TaxID=1641865 RepID=UPI00131B58E8|nr:hypothetical protein [Granulicella sp. L46]